jgi:Flp pilus assembly pilin Flp
MWHKQRYRSSSCRRQICRSRGNTLAEYVLIAGTVLLAVIATAFVIGNNLKTIFADLREDMKSRVIAASTPPKTGSNAPAAFDPSKYPPGATICYSNQWCMNVDVLNNKTTVESTGANGAQQAVHDDANMLKNIAEQLANDPNADPTLLDLVTRLANAGHTIANNLDKAADTYGTGQYFYTYDAFWRSQMPYDDLKAQTLAYLQENPQALPPAVQQALTGAADDINARLALLINSDGPNHQNWDIMRASVDPTHQDSNTICNNGGDTGQCIR